MRRLLVCLSVAPALASAQQVVVQGAALHHLIASIPPNVQVHQIVGGKATALAVPADKLLVKPGAVLSFKAAPAPVTHGGTHIDSPLRVVSVDAKGGVHISKVTWAPADLTYDPIADAFSGTLDVWLEDQDGGQYALPESVQILVYSDAEQLSSSTLRFTGTDVHQQLKVTARSPGDSVRVQLWPDARIDSVTASLRVRPTLRLHVTPARVAGWGLEAAVATVELLGDAHGEYGVTVRPTFADPQAFTLTHQAARTAVLRSRGMGADTVRATGAGAAAGMAVVTYVFPWGLLVALALGSAIGTAALQLSAKRSGRTRPTPNATLWAFIRGLLLGLVAVAAYAVGVKAIPIPIPSQVGEGGAFVVSSLAAYLGLRKR